MIILGIITIPFFMLIFPILLIVFGSRKVRDAKDSDRIFIEQNMSQYGIKKVYGFKPDNIKRQFKEHIEKIKNMDDKTEYFELFNEKLESLAKFMYRTYDHHELMSMYGQIQSHMQKGYKDDNPSHSYELLTTSTLVLNVCRLLLENSAWLL